MLVGYVKVGKYDMNINRQIDALIAEGVDEKNIYKEKICENKGDRPELLRMISELKKGDIVVVVELIKLSRNTKDFFDIVKKIKNKRADLKSLKESWVDTSTQQGSLMVTFINDISKFEHDLMVQRNEYALSAARARGKTGGRPKIINDEIIAMAKSLHKDKSNSIEDICKALKISRTTLYRCLNNEYEKI